MDLHLLRIRVRVLIVISLHFMQKPIHKHKLLKSQIPSTKLQMVRQAHHPEPSRRVNLNLQYPIFHYSSTPWPSITAIPPVAGLTTRFSMLEQTPSTPFFCLAAERSILKRTAPQSARGEDLKACSVKYEIHFPGA